SSQAEFSVRNWGGELSQVLGGSQIRTFRLGFGPRSEVQCESQSQKCSLLPFQKWDFELGPRFKFGVQVRLESDLVLFHRSYLIKLSPGYCVEFEESVPVGLSPKSRFSWVESQVPFRSDGLIT
uniref:Uncharacterized protein n=1 Tax=Cannabis sativa TaxID=3483 RepID=A0A803QS04_CANSA